MEADVCIIGAGVMGSAAAYWMSKTDDLNVVLVEQYSIGNDYCSSHDANRVFRYSYGSDKLYARWQWKHCHCGRVLNRIQVNSYSFLLDSYLLTATMRSLTGSIVKAA